MYSGSLAGPPLWGYQKLRPYWAHGALCLAQPSCVCPFRPTGLSGVFSCEAVVPLAPPLQIHLEDPLSRPQAIHTDWWSVWLPSWGPGEPSKPLWVSATRPGLGPWAWRPWLFCQTGGLLPLAVVVSRRLVMSRTLPLKMARAVASPAHWPFSGGGRPSQILELADLFGQLSHSLHESR